LPRLDVALASILGFNEKQIYLRCKDFGIEARHEVLDEGRKELQESKLGDKEPTLIAAPDTSSLTLERKFDYIWGVLSFDTPGR